MTDGIAYQVLSQTLEEPNKMDDRNRSLNWIYLDFNDAEVEELRTIHQGILRLLIKYLSNAKDLKYTREIKRLLDGRVDKSFRRS